MSRVFRIAMVAACPFPYPRGTPTRILRLAEALGIRGHEVHVVAYHLGEAVSGPFRIHRIPDVPSYRRTAPGPTLRKLLHLDPLLAATLARTLERHAIRIIHAHHYEGLVTALWARRRHPLPVLYDAHTLLGSELPSYVPALTRPLARTAGRWLDRTLPPRATAVATVSEELRTALLRSTALAPERVTVVPNGVEAKRFAAPSPRPPSRAGRPKTLIFTGNLAPYQGIDVLLYSFRRILDRRSDVRLRIVTGGSFAPYETLARSLGVREYIEIIADDGEHGPAYLADADVALNPRVRCEGTPQKLLNYMAAGKPIVSFAGSAYALRHGHSGWLVPGGDDALFAEGTLRCLEDEELAQALGREARRLAECYRWDGAAETLEGIYARLEESPR